METEDPSFLEEREDTVLILPMRNGNLVLCEEIRLF